MASAPVTARFVYLVTYSQANLELVPSQSDFETIVKKVFENSRAGNTLVEWWCCCQEKHQDGNPHFHLTVKLKMQRQWLLVCSFMSQHYGIQVNCSPQAGNYCNAWEYCTKAYENYVQSENHPDFKCAPRTTAATECKQAAAKHTRNGEPQKKRRKSFDALDLQHIVIKNCLKTKKGLLRFANKQLHLRKTDTAF